MASRPAILSPVSSLFPAPLLRDRVCLPTAPMAARTLLPSLGSVKEGRDFTRATLRDWDMRALTEVAELVVSELVTNALQHGIPAARKPSERQFVGLRLRGQDPLVMCLVTDPGRGLPVLQENDPAAEDGRGLALVEACCVRWGWHLLDEGGKVVWALLQ